MAKKDRCKVGEELLEAVLAAGGEIVGWDEVKDSKGNIHIVPRGKISKKDLAEFEKKRRG